MQEQELPDFTKGDGLIPAIAQDHETGQVLMLAWMNEESFRETVATNQAVYFSRSRDQLWKKGERSGHTQEIVAIHVDCDGDSILLQVNSRGAACHQGYLSCFYRQLRDGQWHVQGQPLFDPADVYAVPADSGDAPVSD